MGVRVATDGWDRVVGRVGDNCCEDENDDGRENAKALSSQEGFSSNFYNLSATKTGIFQAQAMSTDIARHVRRLRTNIRDSYIAVARLLGISSV